LTASSRVHGITASISAKNRSRRVTAIFALTAWAFFDPQ